MTDDADTTPDEDAIDLEKLRAAVFGTEKRDPNPTDDMVAFAAELFRPNRAHPRSTR